MPPDTRVFANRYELGDEIGHGGMADVYLAHDRLLDRARRGEGAVARVRVRPTNVERFRREAQAAAGLNHPHIVAVYDWGEEDDTSFIVMEYVPGQTLRDDHADVRPPRADGRGPHRGRDRRRAVVRARATASSTAT